MTQTECDEKTGALQMAIEHLVSLLKHEPSPIVRLHYADTITHLNLCMVNLQAQVEVKP